MKQLKIKELFLLKQDLKHLRDKWAKTWKKACKKSSPLHLEFRIDKLRATRFKRLISKIEGKKEATVEFTRGLFK